MPTIEAEKLNESVSRIFADDEDLLCDLEHYFTVENEAVKWINIRNQRNGVDYRLPDKKSFFNSRRGIICNGLLPLTEKWCQKNGYEFKKHYFPDLPQMTMEEFQARNKEILGSSTYTPRDYQEEAAYLAYTKRKGILECCTSSGKSLIIYLIIRNLLKDGVKNILLCVPNITLVTQMYSDFKDYGWTDEEEHCELLYGGEKPTFEKEVLISTWQSLQNKERDFFEKFDAVIYDECHSSKAQVVNHILMACENSRWRIGTTGTLPTSKMDLLQIACALGSVLYRITSAELIKRGFLTRMIIAAMFIKYPKEFIKRVKGADYNNEVREFESCDARQIAISQVISHTKKEHNLLVLVNHVDHLSKVADYVKEKFPERQVEVISGSVSAKKREEIRQDAENREGLVIVATYGTCSTGVNIKKLHGIVLYSNSKSKIKVLQSLGRGLRKHATKDKVILYDIIDDCRYVMRTGNTFENRLYKHWLERKKFYETEGYPIKGLNIAI